MNYFIKNIMNNMENSLGKEKAYEILFTIVNEMSVEDRINDKSVYLYWQKNLPKEFKLPKYQKDLVYAITSYLPTTEKTLRSYLLTDISEFNYSKLFEFYNLSKPNKKKLISEWFENKEVNELGVKVIEFYECIHTYDFDVEINHNVALTKNGLFHMNNNELMTWDKLFELLQRKLCFLNSNNQKNLSETLKEIILEELY